MERLIFIPHASSSSGNLYSLHAPGGARLLIEAGLSLKEIRRALDFKLSLYEGCLISHFHQDHACAAWDLAKAGIDVWASEETLKRGTLVGHRFHRAKPRKPFRIKGWRVLPFDLRHDAEGCLGYLVEHESGGRLLFAIDTAFIPYRFDRLTHIAIEVNYSMATMRNAGTDSEQQKRLLRTHMSLERAVKWLGRNDLSQVREIHLLHLSDRHGDPDAFRASVEAATGKPVFIAPKRRI